MHVINKILVLALIISLFTMSGKVFAYKNPPTLSPEKVIEQMAKNLTEVKSLEYSGEVSMKFDNGDFLTGGHSLSESAADSKSTAKKDARIKINFSGVSNVTDLQNTMNSFFLSFNTDALSGGNSSVGLEARSIGKIMYIKLHDIPNLGFIDLGSLKGQWIKIDIDELQKELGIDNLEKKSNEGRQKKNEGVSDLSKEQIKKLEVLSKKSRIIKIIKKFANKEIDGVETHHYTFIVDKGNLRKTIIEGTKIIENRKLTKKELSKLDEDLKSITPYKGEIWIGKKDLLPYKLSLNTVFAKTSASKNSGTVSFVLTLKNFNKLIQVDVPQQTRPIKEVFSELFVKFTGESSKKSADIEIKANLTNILFNYDTTKNPRSYGEPFALASCPTNLVTGTTLFASGIDSINKATIQGGGGNACVVTTTGWAVAVTLKSNNTTAWCVDSTGQSKKETLVSANTPESAITGERCN